MKIASFFVNAKGSGYTNPTVVIEPVDGLGTATATATLGPRQGGGIVAVNLTETDGNFTAAPTVTIVGGSGSGASVTAVMEE